MSRREALAAQAEDHRKAAEAVAAHRFGWAGQGGPIPRTEPEPPATDETAEHVPLQAEDIQAEAFQPDLTPRPLVVRECDPNEPVRCADCGAPTMHDGPLCYGCSHLPSDAAPPGLVPARAGESVPRGREWVWLAGVALVAAVAWAVWMAFVNGG